MKITIESDQEIADLRITFATGGGSMTMNKTQNFSTSGTEAGKTAAEDFSSSLKPEVDEVIPQFDDVAESTAEPLIAAEIPSIEDREPLADDEFTKFSK